jgi:NCS1 family nucleobase:cation symporter-1
MLRKTASARAWTLRRSSPATLTFGEAQFGVHHRHSHPTMALPSQTQVFLSVLNTFGVFIAPMTGVLCTDYWIVRHQNLVLSNLYRPHGVCWFTAGINWRIILTFCLALWHSMPRFIAVFTLDPVAEGWT